MSRRATRENEASSAGLTRRALCGGGLALAAGVATGAFAAATPEPMPTVGTPAQASERLREGHARFLAGKPLAADRDLARMRALAQGQEPFAAFLACADSRVPIEIVYDQGFGDLFVVRVAGNIASAIEIASLEFGVAVLGVETITVLGHSQCGAVQAAMTGAAVPGQISTLYQHIVPALDRQKMDLDAAIAANVRYQARRLKDASPVIGQAIADGKLTVVGGVFELKTGTVRPVEL